MTKPVVPAMRSAPTRILLADDDPAVSEMVAGLLDAGGYAVTTCASPESARTRLASETFDLVLADGLSQHADAAWQTANDILRAAGATPAILFSAHAFDPDAARALGYRDYIAKPFDIDDLECRVARVIRETSPSSA